MKCRYLLFFFPGIILLILTSGCERQEPIDLSTFDCADCYQDKPDWGPLHIKVTIDEQNPFVPLMLYIGDIEENNLDWVDTAYTSDFYIDIKPDIYYSLSAKYIEGTDTIFAVDGDILKMKHTSENCDLPCYYFRGGFVDVQLRN